MTRNLRIRRKRVVPIWVFLLLLAGCGGDGPAGPAHDPPVGLAVLLGDEQVRWPGATLTEALWVQAVDGSGAPVRLAGIPVDWRVLSGGGSVLAAESVTNENGNVSAHWTLGSEMGPQRVEARSSGLGTATFSALCAEQGPILFSSDGGGGGSSTRLFVMDEDGGHTMRLPGSHGLVTPDWSPNGSRVVAALGQSAIVVMDPRGGGSDPHLIVNDPAPDSRGIVIERPAWSPDGSRIAFSIKQGAANCQLSDYNIYTVDPDGGNRAQLTEGCGGRNTEADWSPDGSRILFTSRRSSPQDINPNLRDIEIWVMNADGSDQTRLTVHGDNDTSPRWAPSGSKIYFARWAQLGVGGTSSLWQMDPDGGSQEIVRQFVGLLTGIDVSPDGHLLLLEIMELAAYTTDLFVLNIETGEFSQITTQGGSESLGSWRQH